MRTTPTQTPKSSPTQAEAAALPASPALERLAAELAALRAELQQVKQTQADALRNNYKFNGDDSAFLIWVLGFTSGAHLEKSGAQGEVIFARCRDIYMKAFPGAGPLAPMGGNPS